MWTLERFSLNLSRSLLKKRTGECSRNIEDKSIKNAVPTRKPDQTLGKLNHRFRRLWRLNDTKMIPAFSKTSHCRLTLPSDFPWRKLGIHASATGHYRGNINVPDSPSDETCGVTRDVHVARGATGIKKVDRAVSCIYTMFRIHRRSVRVANREFRG